VKYTEIFSKPRVGFYLLKIQALLLDIQGHKIIANGVFIEKTAGLYTIYRAYVIYKSFIDN
jgi:hypothetical protein